MKALFLAGAVWLAFLIGKQFLNPYGPHFGAEHAIGVMILAGLGCFIFKDKHPDKDSAPKGCTNRCNQGRTCTCRTTDGSAS